MPRRAARARSSETMARQGHLPHCRMRPGAVEAKLVLAVAFAQLVGGQGEAAEEVDEAGFEDVAPAVERVAGKPDQLVGVEAQGADVVELGDKFVAVDDVGEADRARAVLQPEGNGCRRLQLPDHLQHQELVEIRVEQRADDRIDAEGVVVGAPREIRAHSTSTLRAARERRPGQFPERAIPWSCWHRATIDASPEIVASVRRRPNALAGEDRAPRLRTKPRNRESTCRMP